MLVGTRMLQSDCLQITHLQAARLINHRGGRRIFCRLIFSTILAVSCEETDGREASSAAIHSGETLVRSVPVFRRLWKTVVPITLYTLASY